MVAAEMNLAFERAGVDDRVTAESHATQLARAREAGDDAEVARLLLNPPSVHIGPAAKHRWEDRTPAKELKPDRYVQYEAAATSAQEIQLAHALDEAAATSAKSEVAELVAKIAALEAQQAAERRAQLEEREGAAVRAMSKGGQWLDAAHQAALAGADRQLTLVEREQSVETVEGELEAEFSRRESALNATSAGPPLLREVFGERSDRDAPLSFSARDHGLEQVEQRVRAELSARDEALQSIPFGRQAAQGRSGDAGGAAETLAEWESRVRGAEQRVGEELDRLEEELVATGALGRDGRTLALGERWEVYERAKSGLEDELEREEAAVREDPAGEEFFRDARLEVLGAAGREAATLGDRARIVKAAAAAKRQADEKWNEEKAARVEALDRLDGGMDLYHAHLADLDPKCSLTENTPPAREHDDAALAAAESDGTRLKSLRGVLSDEDAATRYREELGRVAGQFNTADLDRALATGKREQQRAAERREAEKRRRAHVEKREGALRATSLGGRWLDEAHQEALAGADRQLALVEREQSVETVEGELEAEFSRRESALNATSAGPPLLREVFGERSDRDAPLSFSARDHGIEQVEQRVRAELSARDEALQSIPFGRQAAQGRSGDAGGAAETLAEWESRVRGAEQRVGEEFDRLEEELDELEREEAAVREDPACEEFFRDARLEVLGAAGREAATLGDCARIVKAAAAAKRQADEKWNEEKAARVEALYRLDGGMDLYNAHLADLDPKWSLTENTPPAREHDDAALAAAESDGTRLKSLRGVLSDEDAATRYREELGRVAGQFNTADLDRALAAGEREQQRAAERREAEKQRRAHVEKREGALRATSLGGRWLDEAHQAGADRQLALVERERIADTVESRFASDLARREAALAATPSGLALLRQPYGEAGIADPPRSFLRRERVVEHGEWEAKRDTRLQALGKQHGGTDLFYAHLADLDPGWDRNRNNTTTRENIDAALDAAESDDTRLARLRDVLSDEAAAARCSEVLNDIAGQFKTADLDRALTAVEREREERRQAEERHRAAAVAERERKERLSRVEQVLSAPASAEAFIAALNAQNPSWRTGASPADIDQALDAEGSLGRRKPTSRQDQLVLDTEAMFPDAPSTTCRDAGGRFDRTTEVGREGWSVSQMLSDRALARAFAAEKPEPPAPRNLAQRLFDWLRTQVERLFRPSRRAETAVSEAPVAEEPPRLTFQERYSQQCPEHAADIHRPDFEKLAAGASARNKLFERQEHYSSKWATVEPGELPAALAKSAPAWSDEAVEGVTWRATPGVGYPERTLRRQTVDAYLSDYEDQLPEQYVHTQEWRDIRARAEDAVSKQHNSLRYKWADGRKDNRKKRELEAAAINRACGRDARRLHEKMMAARETARPDWEVTVRIRDVQELIQKEEADRRFKLRQEQRAQEREHERPVHKPREHGPTRDQGHGRDL